MWGTVKSFVCVCLCLELRVATRMVPQFGLHGREDREQCVDLSSALQSGVSTCRMSSVTPDVPLEDPHCSVTTPISPDVAVCALVAGVDRWLRTLCGVQSLSSSWESTLSPISPPWWPLGVEQWLIHIKWSCGCLTRFLLPWKWADGLATSSPPLLAPTCCKGSNHGRRQVQAEPLLLSSRP